MRYGDNHGFAEKRFLFNYMLLVFEEKKNIASDFAFEKF